MKFDIFFLSFKNLLDEKKMICFPKCQIGIKVTRGKSSNNAYQRFCVYKSSLLVINGVSEHMQLSELTTMLRVEEG
jgi:hypothetical protein